MKLKSVNLLKQKRALKSNNNVDKKGIKILEKTARFDIQEKKVESRNFETVFCYILAFVSGATLACSMPGFELSFLAWVAFVPFLKIIDRLKNYKEVSLASLSFGLGFNLLALCWFLGLHSLEWLGVSKEQSLLLSGAAWVTVSLYCSLFICGWGIWSKFISNSKIKKSLKVISIALGWILFTNIFMSFGVFAFPWAMIEYSQYKNLNILTLSSFIGSIGVGFLIVLFNSYLASLDIAKHKKRIAAAGLVLAVVLSINFPIKTDGIKNNISVIQTNTSIDQEKGFYGTNAIDKNTLISKIKKLPKGLVILPETAILETLSENKNFYNQLENIAKKEDKTIIMGAFGNKDNKVSNTAYVFGQNNQEAYHKQNLVPFGEFIPFKQLLPNPLRKLADTAVGEDLFKGKGVKVFNTAHGKIAPSICFEIIFPRIIKKQSQTGAELLVNISNLSWFHDSIIKDQFIAFGAFRAAENQKPMVIAANTGYSVFIGANGKILGKSAKNVSQTAIYKVD